jgi:endonuclease YncB( thermonuclease family)
MSRYRSAQWRRRAYKRPRSAFRKFLDYLLTAAILGLLVLVSARLDRVETRKPAGSAVVNDGDSLTLGEERIRLRGIDAPEFTQTCVKGNAAYPCGRRSREALLRFVAGRDVACTGWERDRFGRLLATCRAGDVELNRAQVETGWAIAYGDYFDAEEEARERKLGLWAGSFERPRDWRATHGEMYETEHDLGARVLNWLREIFRFS